MVNCFQGKSEGKPSNQETKEDKPLPKEKEPTGIDEIDIKIDDDKAKNNAAELAPEKAEDPEIISNDNVKITHARTRSYPLAVVAGTRGSGSQFFEKSSPLE